MNVLPEFRYRLPGRVPGRQPGAHRSVATGTGLEFRGHARLFDRPDPRRLDLRASLVDLHGDWLVRTHRQLSALVVRLIVDVSASMRFGAPRTKMSRVADFARSLGHSTFRVGDALGLAAFDAAARDDLFMPARRGRGVGEAMAAALESSTGGRGDAAGLRQLAERLGGRPGLVFLVSDFLWPLRGLDDALALLQPAYVVPIGVRDAAETAPPGRDGLALLADAETGERRSLWVRPAVRERWQAASQAREDALERVFARHGLRPYWMTQAFDAAALERHLLESTA